MTRAGEFVLGTFSIAGAPPFAGLVLNGKVISLDALLPLSRQLKTPLKGIESIAEFLLDWEANITSLTTILNARAMLEQEKTRNLFMDMHSMKIHPPLDPPEILCSGANYRKHVVDLIVAQGGGPQTEGMNAEDRRAYAEKLMDERALRGTPYIFSKLPSSITGPLDPIILPSNAKQPDWELELAVIMGRSARHVPRADALRYVAGYSIANDITARDLVFRSDLKAMGTDWVSSKSAPTFTPFGPFLVPARFIGDPQNLNIRLKLNGQLMQDESTEDMIFDVSRLIEYASSIVQLCPGDVILTGSPAGNGAYYNRFLQPGDVIESSITGLGEQRNTCIAERS
jgi:2,4-didehydro-3-deoxy-L-rhamnonate hydrolase